MFLLVSKHTPLHGIICQCAAYTNLSPEFLRDCSEASFLLLTFILSLSYVELWIQQLFFSISPHKNSLPPLKSRCLLRCVFHDCVALFPPPWPPCNQQIPTVRFLPRPWDAHVNWSLLFTHHFPVGSDSHRLSSASSPFLLADTSGLTYPREAGVFSCWSHSVFITWECSIERLFIYFPMLPARISSCDNTCHFWGGPQGDNSSRLRGLPAAVRTYQV